MRVLSSLSTRPSSWYSWCSSAFHLNIVFIRFHVLAIRRAFFFLFLALLRWGCGPRSPLGPSGNCTAFTQDAGGREGRSDVNPSKARGNQSAPGQPAASPCHPQGIDRPVWEDSSLHFLSFFFCIFFFYVCPTS